MNRIGMFVDMSHISNKTMHDVLDVTKAPGMKSRAKNSACGNALTLCERRFKVTDQVMCDDVLMMMMMC